MADSRGLWHVKKIFRPSIILVGRQSIGTFRQLFMVLMGPVIKIHCCFFHYGVSMSMSVRGLANLLVLIPLSAPDKSVLENRKEDK